MKNSNDRVMDCTTASFTGMAAMMKPSKSWVSKWQRSDQAQLGIYALKVFGKLSDEVLDELQHLELS